MAKKQLQLWVAVAAAGVVLVAMCVCADANLISKNARKQFLGAHNEAREAVGVGRLRWSKNLASYASSQLAGHDINIDDPAGRPGAASCELSQQAAAAAAASCRHHHRYGANQAVGNLFESPATVVGYWVEEGRRYYNYGYNSCAPGHQNECDSYSQVVWRKTLKMGCGKANCGKDGSHTLCLYYPPGNVPGERPY